MRQIKNNDASSIQLKLRTNVEVDAETALEKIPINGEHIHVQLCRFKCLKWLLPKPCYNRQCWKGALKNLGQRWLASTSNKHILDAP